MYFYEYTTLIKKSLQFHLFFFLIAFCFESFAAIRLSRILHKSSKKRNSADEARIFKKSHKGGGAKPKNFAANGTYTSAKDRQMKNISVPSKRRDILGPFHKKPLVRTDIITNIWVML